MKYKIYGESVPTIPWVERDEEECGLVWRSKFNPIIKRDCIPCANSVLNSAVVTYNGKYAGVFRIDDKERALRLHRGFSEDGIHWDIDQTPLSLIDKEGNKVKILGYDPRIVKLEDTYYISYCNCVDGPTVAIAFTRDFETFYDLGNVFLPFNRNGVIFPRKIDGKYAILTRPSDNGHTPFGDIFYSESPDMEYWGHHHHVMSPKGIWDSTKVGAGPVPIETSEGWLLIFHGVLTSCNGYVYSAGAAILDRDEPWKVRYRAKPYIMAPTELYEQIGDVPNVVFPCASICDAETGRVTIYYGAADTVVCMAHSTVDELIDFVKENAY